MQCDWLLLCITHSSFSCDELPCLIFSYLFGNRISRNFPHQGHYFQPCVTFMSSFCRAESKGVEVTFLSCLQPPCILSLQPLSLSLSLLSVSLNQGIACPFLFIASSFLLLLQRAPPSLKEIVAVSSQTVAVLWMLFFFVSAIHSETASKTCSREVSKEDDNITNWDRGMRSRFK